MTHRQIYDRAKKLAREHRKYCDKLGSIERKKFNIEFAETDSDRIIDTINYGTDNYTFEEYLEEMKFYAKSFKKTGEIKTFGIYTPST